MSDTPVAPLPPSYDWGFVVGRSISAMADTVADPDRFPEARGSNGRVTFTPHTRYKKELSAPTAFVQFEVITAKIENGNVIDAQGEDGIYLISGAYKVAFTIDSGSIPGFDILVTPDHTLENPLDLVTAAPLVPEDGTPVTTAIIPAGAAEGQVIGWRNGRLVWIDGLVQIEAAADRAEAAAAAAEEWTPSFAWDNTNLVINGEAGPDLKGDQGIQGERGSEGPYGGTEVTDPQVASWVSDEDSDTSEALDSRLVAQARPVPTDEVVTSTPVQHPLPAATPHDAFPGLTRTGDGSYLASWRGGEGHNSSDGTVYLSRSWDGRAWSVPVAVPSDVHPDGDARDVSIAQLGEFTVLTYYSAGANLSYLRKSIDNGETWGPSIYLPFNSGGIEFISAPAVEVDGVWLVTAYGNSAVRVLRSTDQGETWSEPIVVARGGVQEPNLISLDGQQVRVVWRTNYDGIAKTALSVDGGLTWGPASDAYWGQGNPHLVRLRSGAVVSTYKSSAGHSTNRYSYACTRISFDGGATWGPETVFGYASRKMAYAQAVETDIDGEMLCVWSAETSNTAARLYSVRLTHGGAITRGGEAPSPVTPRPGIARQILSLQKSSDQVISPSTWTAVEWEDERADHWEGFNPSRSLTEFKVDETGLYVITFRAAWNSSTPFTLAINPTAGPRQILHDSWDGVDGAVFKDGTLNGIVELEEGVAYQAEVRHRTEESSRRLLSGNYAYRTRLSVAKIKGF